MKNLIVIITVFCVFISFMGTASAQPDNRKKEPNLKREEFLYHLHEASRQKMVGNINEAILHLSKAIEINKKSAAAYYELAGLYFHLTDVEKATSLALIAQKINPENEWYNIMVGELYKAGGDYKKAVKTYDKLLKINPNNTEYRFEKAEILTAIKQYKEAIAEYNIIDKEMGVNEFTAMTKEELYIKLGEKEKALNELKNLVLFYPTEPRFLGILAETYLNDGNLNEAWVYYQKMLAIDSTNGFLHLSLADFYRIKKDYDNSFKELKIAFASEDVSHETKIKMLVAMLSYMNFNGELKEQVYELLQILLETHPNEAGVHAFYADFLINDKQYEQARNELRIVLQNEKKQYLIWEQLLIINSQLNDFQSLLDESNAALDYFPNQPLVYYFKGYALFSLKDNENAIKSLKTGIDLVFNNNPLKVQFYSLLSEAYNKTNEHALSNQTMDSALELDPQNLLILNNYAYYLSLRKENLEKAERMSRVTVEANPKNHTYLDTYAWVLFQLEKYEKAHEYIQQAITFGGANNGVIVEHYGDILYKLGNTDEAVIQWEKASKVGKTSDKVEQKIKERKYID